MSSKASGNRWRRKKRHKRNEETRLNKFFKRATERHASLWASICGEDIIIAGGGPESPWYVQIELSKPLSIVEFDRHLDKDAIIQQAEAALKAKVALIKVTV